MNTKDKNGYKTEWSVKIGKRLKGRKIVNVRWMDDQEVEDMGWYGSAVVIQLDDGTLLFPSRDDEGNDAGSLFGTKGDEFFVVPVI
jgi:hypothetical protein